MAQPDNYSTKTLAECIGHDFGESDPVVVDQQMINGFADVTGDHQWIHVDVEKATKHSPFGGPIAHGFLTLSLLAAAAESAEVAPKDAKAMLNYGLSQVRFLAPVLAGSTVRARYKLVGVDDKGGGNQLMRLEATLQADGAEKPAVVAELLAMVVG
ncbi:MaoC family dehydratase [Sedimentitalea arenosa]|jgi:acyl dehydratase|uniref:MaoC family dehydratase n=1 Tax=Sedimentitalea arenosa TaxID=2798803 RepID=A0A8J7LUS9_9RHOB|nr:MaoC family dehydratase [Arenibacterium arenosum]MBJ6370125.1 MaoC family dehydratase [Arenibacterium arenosum]